MHQYEGLMTLLVRSTPIEAIAEANEHGLPHIGFYDCGRETLLLVSGPITHAIKWCDEDDSRLISFELGDKLNPDMEVSDDI